MIHVGYFLATSRRLPRNISVARVTGKFRGSRRNGIWAFAVLKVAADWRQLMEPRLTGVELPRPRPYR